MLKMACASPRHIPGADEVLPQIPTGEAPAIAEAIAAADKMARAATADLTGEGTILLVEDEEGLRALNARGLSSRGYTVLEASNGVEAIEAFARHGQVDLVVSDVVMPEVEDAQLLHGCFERSPWILAARSRGPKRLVKRLYRVPADPRFDRASRSACKAFSH